MTEQEIFEGIARKDNKTFLYLYNQHQGMILRMVQKNNGNEEDASDVFQEGLIGLWTNISKGTFQIQNSAKVSTYLYALCRNIWISKLRKKKTVYSLDDNPHLEIADEIDEMEQQHEQINQLEAQFKKLGDNCRKLLTLFYYQKTSLKIIAEQLDITEKTAKNNKYRCMQKLRTIYTNQNMAL